MRTTTPHASSPSDAILEVEARGRTTRVALGDLVAPDQAEEAERLGHDWIKALRTAMVDGRSFRDRFTYRGDSLWWFAELYLHKQRTSVQIFKTIFALEALMEREQPEQVTLLAGGPVARALAPQVAARRTVAYRENGGPGPSGWRQALATTLASRVYAVSPLIKRRRTTGSLTLPPRGGVVAFVHSAFWREESGDDTYVGPVLQALAARLAPQPLALVGVGPSASFRARSWRRRLQDFREADQAPASIIPIESLSPAPTLSGSRAVWRDRHQTARALLTSPDLRAAATISGYDVWPLVRDDLSRIATLQFPWSARAMDEAAAALDALGPRVVVTYAEAGGWGRAIVLEARRRRIPVVGVQHGFISRHWLNYLHEADELALSRDNPHDPGCPLADLTLLYDEFARRHLVTAGRYPEVRLRVVGNPRLDALVAAARGLKVEDLERARQEAGARPDQHLVLLAAKRIPEFDATFGALMRAVAEMPHVHLAIRPHPAETPEPYEQLAAGAPNIRVVPLSLSPVALIAAARLVVTINSTVAIEAMALDVPALAMRMPNYLSPFVEAGAMAGTTTPQDVGSAVRQLVYDELARGRLAAGRRAFLETHAMAPDGRAAERAAEAILST